MPMTRNTKEAWVKDLNTVLSETGAVFVTSYKGLSVAKVSELRAKFREVDASYKVTKNRLTRLALKGTDYEPLSDLFVGTTAVAWGENPVSIAKVIVEFAKENEKLEILGGAMGKEQFDVAGVKALASLPTVDEIRAKIISVIQTPARNMVGVLKAPSEQVARLVNSYSKKVA